METIFVDKKKEWKNLLKAALNEFEIIIYKFSPTCALSSYTDEVINNWCKSQDKNNNRALIKVDVVNSKPLSILIEKELKVKHESPQLIWLGKEMNVKFSASHYEIKEEELNKYI